ncbi:RNA polymerase II large subunit CTD [Penicillium robsamsonii]|uniref:RNA polymerase II large subunit CTD n=1 Tax=Penicillium robsamsonii TaxID=1792511 RepID=UPI002549B96A|nr:RNA polymerase II large subunit CTD [Penicillium robsamsonii]KAJ5836978.1 RNA polymerase II large subunit CTD [Penicillium robsamsonii]
MATPLSVVIPKAAFAACLLRPDPTSVPHDEISDFHTCLERALSHCSPANIQTCKAWLLRFVAFSANRLKGLVNYLEALAASLHPQPTGSKVSPKRQRLHILYLLNDLLHHCKYHLGTTSTFSTVSGSLQLHLVNLVGYAATCDRQKNPRHHRRLDDLLDIWSEHEYFHPELINKLREVVTMGGPPPSDDAADELTPAKKSGKDAPFIMPSTHGDPSTRWHEVRAGNIYPHIIPDSTIPIQPDSTKPIKLLAGPADQKSVDALKGFLADVNKLFDPEAPLDEKHTDTDELGQTVIRGENTDDILDGQHYYGWSLEFCQPADTDTEDLRDRSRSRSGSPTYHKRRRYSDSSSSQSEPESPRQGFRGRHGTQLRGHSPRRSPSPESSYTPRETSHFPPPHQSQHPSAPTNSFPPAHPPLDSMPIIPWALTPAIPKYRHPTTDLGLRLPLTRICQQCPSLHPDPQPHHQLSLLHTIILLLCRRDRTKDKGTGCPRVSITSLLLILGVSRVDHGDLLLLPRAGEAGNKPVHMKRCKSYV